MISPEHAKEVIEAGWEIGGCKALRREGSEQGNQLDNSMPDELLLGLAEGRLQHGLDNFPVPCQHELACMETCHDGKHCSLVALTPA